MPSNKFMPDNTPVLAEIDIHPDVRMCGQVRVRVGDEVRDGKIRVTVRNAEAKSSYTTLWVLVKDVMDVGESKRYHFENYYLCDFCAGWHERNRLRGGQFGPSGICGGSHNAQ